MKKINVLLTKMRLNKNKFSHKVDDRFTAVVLNLLYKVTDWIEEFRKRKSMGKIRMTNAKVIGRYNYHVR